MTPIDRDERVLGRLEEFQRQADRRFDKIERDNSQRFSNIEGKIDDLNEFKWRMAGGAFVLSIALTGAIELVKWIGSGPRG